MSSNGTMILPAHLSESVGRTDHGGFRRSECSAWLQCPAEMIRMNSHNQTTVLILAALYSRFKITAVQQHGAIAYTCILIRILVTKNHKRIVLVAGCPAHTACTLYSGAKRPSVHTPFHQVMPVERDHVQI